MSNENQESEQSTSLVKITHYGTIHIGLIDIECMVTEKGERGYALRQLAHAVGFLEKRPQRSAFAGFLEKIAPNALDLFNKSAPDIVSMPTGGIASFIPVGILTEIVSGVIDAALEGRLKYNQQHLLPRCRSIYRALAKTGEAALIDEATGYQNIRESDGLQRLFAKLLRDKHSTWECRFNQDFYAALYRMMGWELNLDKVKPQFIGWLTMEYIYKPIFPKEIIEEIKTRKGTEKMHQWLNDNNGMPLLEKQRDTVTVIAQSSKDYVDFKTRCGMVFNSTFA